jgi:hypothetical protein
MNFILIFDNASKMALNFDNATHATDWVNENILVPALESDCGCP